MTNFDLEERTAKFAWEIRLFIKFLPKTYLYTDDIKQLIRASGSVAANYIEANESLSKNDYFYRVKICRKESKESSLWLRLLIFTPESELNKRRNELLQEARELVLIFASILRKSSVIK